VLPRPSDWDDLTQVAGYWFLDPATDWVPPVDVVDFLRAGAPPVYIGFGSPGLRQQTAAAGMVVEALRQSGLRALVNLPSGAFAAAPPAAQVLLLSKIPHAWLFARCAALAHHGGAGTTAAGLRAGVPALVIPLATDQFFWGSRVQALGVGPKPLPQRALTTQRLAQGLLQAAQDSAMQRAAGELGAKIRAEDGLAAAIARVRSLL